MEPLQTDVDIPSQSPSSDGPDPKLSATTASSTAEASSLADPKLDGCTSDPDHCSPICLAKPTEPWTIFAFGGAVLPLVLGLIYVSFCTFVSYLPFPFVVSHSMKYANEIQGAMTVLANIWVAFSLQSVEDLVDCIQAEEWYRRLSLTLCPKRRSGGREIAFKHVNQVSCNIGGIGKQAENLFTFFSGSSSVFKAAFISSLLSVGLNHLGPALPQLFPGWYSIGTQNISIPSLPPLSLHSNLSAPFNRSSSPSSKLSNVYILVGLNEGYIQKDNSFPNTVAPLPYLSAIGDGEFYDTDVAYLDYTCHWLAPKIGEPEWDIIAATEQSRHRTAYSAGGYKGSGKAPFFPGTVTLLDTVYKADSSGNALVPSYDGAMLVVVQSAPFNANIQYTDVEDWWIDLASVPTSPIPPVWSTFQDEWANLHNRPITTDISMLLCLPQVDVQSYHVHAYQGAFETLDESLPYRVGNIDQTQLKIALSDSLLSFATSSSTMFRGTPFMLDNRRNFTHYTPANESDLESFYARLAQVGLSAYLDGGPFGMRQTQSIGERLGLVLKADRKYLAIVAILYILISFPGIFIISLRRTEEKKEKHLSVSNVLQLVHMAEGMQLEERTGREITQLAKEIGGKEAQLAEGEDMVSHAFRNAKVWMYETTASDGKDIMRLSFYPGTWKPRGRWGKILRRARNRLGILTPVLGGCLVAFGVYTYVNKVIIPVEVMDSRHAMIATLFTTTLGLWRTLALWGVRKVIKEVRSEEWTRMITLHGVEIPHEKNLTTAFEDVSSDNLSTIDVAWYTILFKPRSFISSYYRLAFFSLLSATLCSTISQGAIQIQLRPGVIQDHVPSNIRSYSHSVQSLYSYVGDQPWATERTLMPQAPDSVIAAFESLNEIGNSFTYLEQIGGGTIGIRLPVTNEASEGYFLMQPQETIFDSEANVKFLTDLGTWKMSCGWTIPTLQTWTRSLNHSSFLSIEIPERSLRGLMLPPSGHPNFVPLQQPQIIDSQDQYIFTGLFAWTLFGSSSGAKVNLDNVPHANLSSEWQDWIRDSLIPTYDPTFTRDFVEVPTKLTTLVCEPNVEVLYRSSAMIYEGTVSLDKRNEVEKKIGNVDLEQLSHLVYYMGSLFGSSDLGTFLPFLPIGALPGLMALSPALKEGNSTIPRSGKDISQSLNKMMTSQLKAISLVALPDVPSFSAEIGQRYVLDVSLPLLIPTSLMFILLSIIVIIFELRIKLRRFSLAGILLAGGTNLQDWDDQNKGQS
ncbi:hypothetical protein BT69DRAFT_1348633 [Atractiella rhizophila]|nr:hypothetical protein BT69DRAFT_1348633 [Atractiella rhizophila]